MPQNSRTFIPGASFFFTRLAAAATLTGVALLLAGCVTPPQQQPRVEMIRDLALLSSLGDEYGSKLTSVDGVPLAKGGLVGRQPGDMPAGMNSSAGVWLAPGFHLIHVQYVRNIEAGISFTQGDVPIRGSAGHTYMIHPVITTDSGKVSFSVIDNGVSFPIACLPASISMANRRTRAESV